MEIILKVQVASVGEALRNRDSVAWMLGPLCHHLLCDLSMPVTSLVQACLHMPSLCICISPAASEAWLWVFFRVPCFFDSGIQGFLVPKEPTLPSLLSTRTLKCMGKVQYPEVLVRMHICAHQWTNLQLVHCSLNSDQLTTDNRGRTPDRKGFIFFFCKISLCCFSASKSCLQLHGPQHTRLPYPSLFLEFAQTHVHWVGDAISSSVTRFSSWPQSFAALRSFPTSWLFASGGQNIEASAWVPPMNIQGWFPLGID